MGMAENCKDFVTQAGKVCVTKTDHLNEHMMCH